jgi:hypothetical protein
VIVIRQVCLVAIQSRCRVFWEHRLPLLHNGIDTSLSKLAGKDPSIPHTWGFVESATDHGLKLLNTYASKDLMLAIALDQNASHETYPNRLAKGEKKQLACLRAQANVQSLPRSEPLSIF